MNHDGNSSQPSLILPVERLGFRYIIGTTDPFSPKLTAHNSQVTITALYDNTTVTIQLKFESNSSLTYQNDQYFSGDKLTLNKFESFKADLTGTLVGADLPVAVFTGNRCNKLQTFGYLMEQLPPIDDLDDEFIVPPSLEFGGSKVRINPYWVHFWWPEIRESLGFRNLPGCKNLQRSFRLHQSSEPILVLGFAIRMNQQEEGDPYMSPVPGFSQYLSQYSLVVPGGYTKNFLSVILKQAYVSTTRRSPVISSSQKWRSYRKGNTSCFYCIPVPVGTEWKL